MADFPVRTPKPPYYAVIFAFELTGIDRDDYVRLAGELGEKAAALPGFLGEDALRMEDGRGMTVSYWTGEDAVTRWREDAEHILARKKGRDIFYKSYELRVAKVERAYGFVRKTG